MIKIALLRAAGTLVDGLNRIRAEEIGLETHSVYGAVILLPMLARSAGYPKYLLLLAINCYIVHLINLIVQGGLLFFVTKDVSVMALFSGQMYLCDFGSHLQDCPGNPGCTGPAGSRISAPRLYNWNQWVTRVYARDALKALFPDKVDDIDRNVDPGEYGVESNACRFICCFIYMLSCLQEVLNIWNLMSLLIQAPTSAQPWLRHVPGGNEDGDADEDSSWIDQVHIQVAGIPACWKVVYFVTVFLPKCLLWFVTVFSGVNFLMETPGMTQVIVNSVALSFILEVDEMILTILMPDAVVEILQRCRPLLVGADEPPREGEEAEEDQEVVEEWISDSSKLRKISADDQELLAFLDEEHVSKMRFLDLHLLVNWRLVMVFLMTPFFIYCYYWTHCIWSETGRWYSQDMHLPKTTRFSVLNAFFPSMFPVPSEHEPYWKMPPIDES